MQRENGMSVNDGKGGMDRRGFLRNIGGGAAGAATVAVAAVLPEPAEASESAADKKKKRYQANSAHVQTFYKTNRY
jgi:hypothetical protein